MRFSFFEAIQLLNDDLFMCQKERFKSSTISNITNDSSFQMFQPCPVFKAELRHAVFFDFAVFSILKRNISHQTQCCDFSFVCSEELWVC